MGSSRACERYFKVQKQFTFFSAPKYIISGGSFIVVDGETETLVFKREDKVTLTKGYGYVAMVVRQWWGVKGTRLSITDDALEFLLENKILREEKRKNAKRK